MDLKKLLDDLEAALPQLQEMLGEAPEEETMEDEEEMPPMEEGEEEVEEEMPMDMGMPPPLKKKPKLF